MSTRYYKSCAHSFQNNICATNAITGNVINVLSIYITSKSIGEISIFDPNITAPVSDKYIS